MIRLRTREGMEVAKAKGRLRGKQPKLKPNQAKHRLELHDSGSYTQTELAELFGVGRSTAKRRPNAQRSAGQPAEVADVEQGREMLGPAFS
jgi:DNA invertase Pin-like site-specific DNA recombinase